MNTSNQITVIGNVGEAPEARAKTKSGKSVVAFAIAQNVSGVDADSGERVQREPQWFRITCFGSLGDRVVANARKGDLLLVAGELKVSPYTDKAGTKRLAFEIVASDVLKVERLRAARDEKTGEAPGPTFDQWTGEGVAQ
ncbi:single-stranded DNA-binding protein [Bdellovibrionota bacterium FG-1]